MKDCILICLLSILFLQPNFAQEDFYASVSQDSILVGNSITVEFTIENIQGKFEAPDFENCKVYSGPNMMSSMQSINGKSTSAITYSYVIEPLEVGEFLIEKAYLDGEDKTLETEFIIVDVYPNPDGIIQKNKVSKNEFHFNFPFERNRTQENKSDKPSKDKRKKKYTLKKI